MSKILIFLITVQLILCTSVSGEDSRAAETISSSIRCSVCGMQVSQYPDWITQIHYDDLKKTRFFDGVKDMMAYYFNPAKYADSPPGMIRDLYIKDYNKHAWLSARDAYFVAGSDIYGPMGQELIPFASREEAESFLKEHHGREILTFEQITQELIQSMRQTLRMR